MPPSAGRLLRFSDLLSRMIRCSFYKDFDLTPKTLPMKAIWIEIGYCVFDGSVFIAETDVVSLQNKRTVIDVVTRKRVGLSTSVPYAN